jgi:hypothetical protein
MIDGEPVSHFELYRSAMLAAGAGPGRSTRS